MKYTKMWVSVDDQVKLLTEDKGPAAATSTSSKRF